MEFEEFLTQANLNGGTLKDFFVRISFGGETQICKICRLESNGMRIIFGKDETFLNAVKKHDSLVHSFLSTVGSNKLEVPQYNGSDVDIKEALEYAIGGIVVSYSSYEVKVHRLCQTRIALKTTNGGYEKLQRCSKENGMSSMTVFSYRDLFNRMLKSDGWVETSATLIVGTAKIKILLLPTRDHKFTESIKSLKRSGILPSVDVDEEYLSLPSSSLGCCLPMFSWRQKHIQGSSKVSYSKLKEQSDERTPLRSRRRLCADETGPFGSAPLPVQQQPWKRSRQTDDVEP